VCSSDLEGIILHGENVRKHPEWLGAYEASQGEICTSIVEVPLKVGEDTLGVIKIENHRDSASIKIFHDLSKPKVRERIKLFGDEHLKMLTILAGCIAVALGKGMYRDEILNPKVVLSAIPFQTSGEWIPKTKIVCTVVPLNEKAKPVGKNEVMDIDTTERRIKDFIETGMSIARINFSYVRTRRQHNNAWILMKIVKQVSKEMKRPVGVLVDLCGPRIRTGKIRDGVMLKNENEVTITTAVKTEKGKEFIGDENTIPVTYKDLAKDISRNMEKRIDDIYLYIDNGKLKLRVIDANERSMQCEVLQGGELKSNSGINVPGCTLSTNAVTPEDVSNLDYIFDREDKEGCKAVDFIALSFVKTREDVVILRGILAARGRADIPIVAKMETAESVQDINMREIISELARDKETFSALMVARGDLAIETRREDVPDYQTTLITECDRREVPVIVATEMLESMRKNPYPTRAEVADVTNAVREGASAVMLSGETSDGDYPVESVRTLASILRKAEKGPLLRLRNSWGKETASIEVLIEKLHDMFKRPSQELITDIQSAIALPACETAQLMGCPAIVICAGKGVTAKKAASQRPTTPIVAITLIEETAIRLLLCRGTYPVVIESEPRDTEELLKLIERVLKILAIGKAGDLVVSTFGAETGVRPLGTAGNLKTNSMRIIRIET
jgi:pyruvate kinase